MSVSSHTEPQTRAAGLRFSLNRVKIRNYKSIAHCDVQLRPFTLLVGRNGSGKSNFLDAIRFVADGLATTWFQATTSRGTGALLIHRSGIRPLPTSFEIVLHLELSSGTNATFGFELSAAHGQLGLEWEFAKVYGLDDNPIAEYRTIKGEATSLSIHEESVSTPPPTAVGRFYLAQVVEYSEFRELHDALISMNFYNINPNSMRPLRASQASSVLDQDGANVADILAHIKSIKPAVGFRISSYLRAIVPEISSVRDEAFHPRRTVAFTNNLQGADYTFDLYPPSMSDGTLRALGILVAINQLADDGSPIRLVGIEEPETGLHPAAAGVLMDALREASTETQVLVTTHSADLLDRFDLESDELLLATMSRGETRIGKIDEASRIIIEKKFDTAGGLLRMDHLESDPSDLERQSRSISSSVENGEK